MTVNEKIKKYLEEHGITQTFLANKLGCNQSKLSRQISSNRRITAEELGKIAKILNVDVNIFLD